MTRRTSLLASGLLLGTVLPTTACLDHPLKQVELESLSEVSCPDCLPDPRRKVDILFVIDNSGSMGEEQAALAANFSAFVEVLERDEVDADYRIGITTTDNGHPWCTGTGPEAGALQLRTCRSHLDDFVFSPGSAQETDRREEACLAHCPEALAELAPLPTSTSMEPTPRPRPWLQRGDGTSNVPEGVNTAEALACWGPQGIDGCGYEAPLEAMYKALLRSGTDDEDGQGFLRDDALLQVVFITDEADCSLGPQGAAAFDPNGSRALWPDPDASLPPSAVCWNAGVTCETGPDGRTHCEPAELDAEGEPAGEGEEVLHPLARYFEILENIDENKLRLSGRGSQVFVSVIAGVPPDYDGVALDYGPGDDPEFVESFGVGPGCSSGNGQAVPPVRLRALADTFSDDVGTTNLFSICDGDYTPALEAIAETLVGQLRPNCVRACVAGTDGLIAGDLPTCTVVQQSEGTSGRIATCTPQTDGTWARPEGEDLCVYAVTEDDLDEVCQADGLNVELRFLRAPGASLGDVSVTCEVSQNRAIDCPGLEG